MDVRTGRHLTAVPLCATTSRRSRPLTRRPLRLVSGEALTRSLGFLRRQPAPFLELGDRFKEDSSSRRPVAPDELELVRRVLRAVTRAAKSDAVIRVVTSAFHQRHFVVSVQPLRAATSLTSIAVPRLDGRREAAVCRNVAPEPAGSIVRSFVAHTPKVTALPLRAKSATMTSAIGRSLAEREEQSAFG